IKGNFRICRDNKVWKEKPEIKLLHRLQAIVTQHQNSPNALLAEGVIELTLVMLKCCPLKFMGRCTVYNYAIVAYDHTTLGPSANGPSLVINGVRRPMPLLRILEVELYPTLLYEARSFGLSKNYIQALVEKDPVRCQVLQVQGCLAGSKAKNLLQQFDMVLETFFEGHEEHQIAKGIPIHSLNQVLKEIISGANGPSLVINGVRRPMPLLRILEIELYPTLLYEARSFGLSNNWIQALVEKDPVRCQVLHVQGCLAGSKAKNLLQQFDMIQDTALVLHTQSIGDGVLYNILIEQQNLGLNGISEYVGTTKYGRRTEDEAS
ncbi:hypothetical protein Tco_1038917, partial [Tanacetum coccineum]